MSSSANVFMPMPFLPSALLYRDVALPVPSLQETETAPEMEVPAVPAHAGPTPLEMAQHIAAARTEAVIETEARLRTEMKSRVAEQEEKIRVALAAFAEERRSYFERVESDVVHLSLAIAAKILHREAQVDSMLIAALVHVAVNKLHDGSRVTVRVGAADGARWSEFLANPPNGCTIQVLEDTHLGAGDCILETDLGSANFSVEAQLKEVEQGFFDLLAQRPAIR